MIKVLHIVPTLGYGGVAQFILNYRSAMNPDVVRFDFVTHGEPEAFHQDLLNEGSRIYYLKTIGSCGIKRYAKLLEDVFRDESYDIVHVHTGHLTGLYATLCRKCTTAKIVCHAHTTLAPNQKHRIAMPLFRWLARRSSDLQVGCGVKAYEYCFGKRRKPIVIHNAVELSRFQHVGNEVSSLLRNRLGIPAEKRIVGQVGALCEQKNHEFTLRVFSKLLKRDDSFMLLLVGDGPLRATLEHKADELGIKDKIVFAGIQADVPAFLATFDIFVMPSLFEGLPVSAIEAQAAGLRCLISDKVDRDVDAGAGLVTFLPISGESENAWIEAMVSSPDSVSADSVANALIESGYELNSSANDLVCLYKNLLSQ